MTKYYNDSFVNVDSHKVSYYIFAFLLQGSIASDVSESPAPLLICLALIK